ncbi:MAG TPA: sugar phosphate nucleotidyltransferase [Bacteroidales bacterium]|nr:sugar phosphate nucleotidyltransferase [Bacteroidales bacterium]HPS71057.1 sugar phosphate nucleotidyltransferase [Bacteroidales bacterium]
MKPTLLILAAGMGSRYGGLKQLDQLGPNGETIMDYSVDYALEAGFGKVVFVIRKNMQEPFYQHILIKYQDKIKVETVYQEINILPDRFEVNPERVKPYGTAHAILMAKDAIKEPFAVINADDFYGKEAFQTMAKFLKTPQTDTIPVFSMIGYYLKNTLSEFGSVSRGVCVSNEKSDLVKITEMTKIQKYEDGIKNLNEDNSFTILTGNEPVSMNFWGFTADFFTSLEQQFIQFLIQNNDNPKSEFPIPSVVDQFISSKKAVVKVLECDASWFGVTYQEDKPYVMKKLSEL